MKVFLAELASLERGFPEEIVEQGEAMLRTLVAGVERAGHDAVVPGGTDLAAAIREESGDCDYGLVIAPDEVLPRYVELLRDRTEDLGPPPEFVETAADKLATLRALRGEVPTPSLDPEGPAVLKPRRGSGSEGVRLSGEEPGEDEFATEPIEGLHASVVLIQGEAVALSEQLVERRGDTFVYGGNRVPLHHGLEEEAFGAAERAVELLGGGEGIVGVDVVLSDAPFVIEVNPRPTVSVVPLDEVMRPGVTETLLELAEGGIPRVEVEGEAVFTC